MSSLKTKIIYSLQIHIQLQAMGFEYLVEMKNPANNRYNCWVYEESPALLDAFDRIVGGGDRNG